MTRGVRRVYLDVCALSRPFDEQSQMRVRLETDAVNLILSHVRAGNLTLIVSQAHNLEIGAIDVAPEREQLLTMLDRVGVRHETDLRLARERAEHLVRHGLGPADAVHLAFAEAARADFVTCDDRLLRQCRRLTPAVWFGTPVAYCAKENLG